MDESIRILERDYGLTGDPAAGAKYYAALLRRDGLVDRLEDECVERTTLNRGMYDSIPQVQTVYIGWDPDTRRITTGVIVLYYFTKELRPPPKARMDQFMSPSERWEYQRAWGEYASQARGDMHIFACTATFNHDVTTWNTACHLLATPPPGDMENVRNILDNSHTFSTQANEIVLASLLHIEEDFGEDMEELEEHPEVIFEQCEDYPSCGHDTCPPRWSDGRQAAMVCTCGKLLPVNARFSICDDCLGVGYDDFGYREGPAYESDEDYEDGDDEEEDYLEESGYEDFGADYDPYYQDYD
jgi:hypothetical protein